MAQPSQKTPIKPNQPNLLWFAGLVAVGMFAGSFGSRFWAGHSTLKPSSKLSDAISEFQSGDEKTAISLLKPLAEGKDVKAEYWLADIYLDDGLGGNTEKAKAIDLLQKSAEQGFAPAQGRLGEIYMNGDDTLQDFAKSQVWLHKAAVAGDVRAQRLLGHTYEIGLGVKQDLAQAYGWYANAAGSGNALAQRMRDDVLARMSHTQEAQGESDAKSISGEIKSSGSNPPENKKANGKS